MHRQSEKNLLRSNISSTSVRNMVNFGPLTAEIGSGVLGMHPCKLQRVSRLGSVTAQHSSSGRQPNFAALNRGRHLCSAGRPSRWALVHILVDFCFLSASQEIGWEKHPRNDLFCVEWNIIRTLTQSINHVGIEYVEYFSVFAQH